MLDIGKNQKIDSNMKIKLNSANGNKIFDEVVS